MTDIADLARLAWPPEAIPAIRPTVADDITYMESILDKVGARTPLKFSLETLDFRNFLETNGLDIWMRDLQDAVRYDLSNVVPIGESIRGSIRSGILPLELEGKLVASYLEICDAADEPNLPMTAFCLGGGDVPQVYSRGRRSRIVGIRGLSQLRKACNYCFAMPFDDRAIAYRSHHELDPALVDICVEFQQMIRSDTGASGIARVIDDVADLKDVVLIAGNWGMVDTTANGLVEPDVFLVYWKQHNGRHVPVIQRTLGVKDLKSSACLHGDFGQTVLVETSHGERSEFCLCDDVLTTLAEWMTALHAHCGYQVTAEWAVDGQTGDLFIVHASAQGESGDVVGSFQSFH